MNVPDVLKFTSVNINGIGKSSTHKLTSLKNHIRSTKTHFVFLQELRTKTLPIHFRKIFPSSLFQFYHSFQSRGVGILVNKTLLPNSDFTLNFHQIQSSSCVVQNLEIISKFNNCSNSLKFTHAYCSPSHCIPTRFYTDINEFKPDVCLGDVNVTAHRADLERWLNRSTTDLTHNLVKFKTYFDHNRKELVTTPDAVYVKPALADSIVVMDSSVIYSDHVRIDCRLSTAILGPAPTPKLKKLQVTFNFNDNEEQIGEIWQTLPIVPDLGDVMKCLNDIKKCSKSEKLTDTDYGKFLKETPTAPTITAEQANRDIDDDWRAFVQECNGNQRLGEIWDFLRAHEANPNDAPKKLQIPRNRANKAFNELKNKCTRPHGPMSRVQHDKQLKVARILRKWHKKAAEVTFDEAKFSITELQQAISGANKASSAGPDGITWAALPNPSNLRVWRSILYAINHYIFADHKVHLPSWTKRSRLVQAPKSNGKLRPISVISCLAILIERLFQARLDAIISADPVLANRFGFVKKRSTEDVIGLVLQNVESAKALKHHVAMLSLDLQSAYDLVDHLDLIIALDEFLTRNNVPKNAAYIMLFCESWLKNRVICFEKTTFQPTVGLAQGAPCSCSFFVIVMTFNARTHSESIIITTYVFADDLQIVLSSPDFATLESALKHTIADVEAWCNASNMILSVEKCRVMWFTEKSAEIGIESADSLRVLGVTIDRKLNFNEHTLTIIDYIKKYLPPLRHLVKLGLSDHLSRQFAMTIRCKIAYGTHWIFKIPATRLETLELWWCNTLRAYLGARRRLSRSYLYAGAGLPKIINYANYILVKRAYFWDSKNLNSRPFLTIQQILQNLQNQHKTHNLTTRLSTSQNTSTSLFQKRKTDTNSTNAALMALVEKHRDTFVKLCAGGKWKDREIRLLLGAGSEKLSQLWTKAVRREIFAKFTPVYATAEDTQPGELDESQAD